MLLNVTFLNHIIERRDETISNLKCLSHRLKINKNQRNVISTQKIYKLSKKNEYFRQKLIMYKNIYIAIKKLQNKTQKINVIFRNTLQNISRKFALSKKKLLKY